MFASSIFRKLVVPASALLFAAVALAAPAPIAPPTEPLTDTEKAGIGSLHHYTVENFIDRPNFGIRRMPVRIDDLLTNPKATPKPDAKDKTAPVANPVPPPQVEQPGNKAKEPHYAVQDLFGNDGQFRILTADKKEAWKVRKVQLVGLLKNPTPVVYLTDKMPDMKEAKEAKEVPTRELDVFEKAALETIKGGESVKAEKHDKTMRVLGPIYAGQRCVKCHEQKGQLLGAFSYELERVPFDAEKEKNVGLPLLPR